VLILNQQQIEELLDLDQLINALTPAMVDLSAGAVSMPQRVVAMVPDEGGLLGVMPAYVPSSSTLSSKLVTVYPDNPQSGLPAHQAVILLFDPASGTPSVLMDGTYITALRTAAGSALATRLLACPDADVLLIVGSGVQAWAHAQAVPRVRSIKEIRIVARDRQNGQQFAQRAADELGIAASFVPSFREAAAGASIVCATTHAAEPVVHGRWLEAGTHLNSVGLSEQGRELDADSVIRSLVVVESRTAVLAEGPGAANDLKIPIADGLITADHIHAEIGELLNGTREGRTSADQITLYKSVGVAVQDAVAAQLVMAAARAQGVGTEVQL
jgi:ornithine cyclodeaminase/alanine dehydrogenase-like protein (mu-crystallin family)